MYKVIKLFTDLQDGDNLYEVGDTFPRIGLEVSKERFAELAGTDNKQGVALIEWVDEPEEEPVIEPEEEVKEDEPEVAESETAEPEVAEEPKKETKPKKAGSKAKGSKKEK